MNHQLTTDTLAAPESNPCHLAQKRGYMTTKHFTQARREAITYALKNCDTVAAALVQLYGQSFTGNEYRTRARMFCLDCQRLDLGAAYKAKYHWGRKARTP